MTGTPSTPTLVLSPHLDDAALSSWHVLSRPGDVIVVNVFDGVPEGGFVTLWDKITGAEESSSRQLERLEEDRMGLGCVDRTSVGLGFFDVQYGRPRPTASAIADAVLQAIPNPAAICAPAGLGGHPDHVLTNVAAIELAGRGIPTELYADMPYAVEHGWPYWVTGADRDPNLNVDALWETYLEDVPFRREHLRPIVRRLDDSVSASKLAALQTYRTQFSALDGGAIGKLTNPLVRRFEVAWEVHADETPHSSVGWAHRLAGPLGQAGRKAKSRLFSASISSARSSSSAR